MIKQFFLLIQSCWIWITTHNKKNAHALTRLRDGMLIWLAKFLSITRLSHYTMACNHLWPLNNEEHSFQKKSSLQITFSKWKKKYIYFFTLTQNYQPRKFKRTKLFLVFRKTWTMPEFFFTVAEVWRDIFELCVLDLHFKDANINASARLHCPFQFNLGL